MNYPSCMDIVYQIEAQKINFKRVLKNIKNRYNYLLYHPDSIRTSLTNIKWSLEKNDYNTLANNHKQLFEYFGIYDNESMYTKILYNLKYID